MPLTGRQIILQRLNAAIAAATTADLQRAAMFLEGASKVRTGSKNQRSQSRSNQANAWKQKVDPSINW